MIRTGNQIKQIVENLKVLGSKSVEFGILEPNASEMVTSQNTSQNTGRNKPITLGYLADILEKGRTYTHKKGVTIVRGDRFETILPGTLITIPGRPFLRTSIESEKKEVFKAVEAELHSMYFAKTKPETILKKQGKHMVDEIKSKIGSHEFAELSPITIWLKGNDLQLKDTGKLKQSVSYKITEG